MAEKRENSQSVILHAYLLEFNLPDDGILRLESELPDDLKQILEGLGCFMAAIDKNN